MKETELKRIAKSVIEWCKKYDERYLAIAGYKGHVSLNTDPNVDSYMSLFFTNDDLNDEIGIAKKVKKTNLPQQLTNFKFCLFSENKTVVSLNDLCNKNFNEMYNKINEIIDYLNSKENE